MKPLLISSGEPAGIGPDICLALAKYNLPIVILADKKLLQQRAEQLSVAINFIDYDENSQFIIPEPNSLMVLSVPCHHPVEAGKLNPLNADYVIRMLSLGTEACLKGHFAALVTAPVHKAVINDAGINFTGHTEFLAEYCGVDTVVMMLACETMKVALVTTHLPLQEVPKAITVPLISTVIQKLHDALQKDFGIKNPRIWVAGLNPHAGEGGYLGREELDTITPALLALKEKGMNVQGPFPADTLFVPQNTTNVDAFVAMYHDQGLPVLKYAGFGQAVNITLGLPIIRTSVDHGTALELAGTGRAQVGSLVAAVKTAMLMSEERASNYAAI
ncbi:4-hydroxythreonine-4-phosphate dehydrogenase [Legionella beliardensis]|uniref:4-hydroxythreonine-4-phosphate dehydrogenase n=1 Tax=Legionella beliardensis TaxID=91822 RepID=A0A378HY75_9GAMM|nr:4-hydroxythreonine-4-phosphate dehydrogenase PdxA [Legionella beliardensis]STX27732.1 4-hydroxythreonine-4-phosphate dehydrogenase [Legionella beliardensis]